MAGLVSRKGMSLEEYRDGDVLVVRAELPGIDPERDVEVTIDRDVLTISAERSETHEEKDKESVRSEFRYGRFVRRLALPAGTSAGDVKATYSDGILEVRLPVVEESASATKVPVTTG